MARTTRTTQRNVRKDRDAAERVQLTHPSGRFTVSVAPARVEVLQRRGYYGDAPAAAERRATTRTSSPARPARTTKAKATTEE